MMLFWFRSVQRAPQKKKKRKKENSCVPLHPASTALALECTGHDDVTADDPHRDRSRLGAHTVARPVRLVVVRLPVSEAHRLGAQCVVVTAAQSFGERPGVATPIPGAPSEVLVLATEIEGWMTHLSPTPARLIE